MAATKAAHSGMSEIARTSFKLFGPLAVRSRNVITLRDDLRRSRHGLRAEAYLSYCMLVGLVATVASLALTLFGWFFVFPILGFGLPILYLPIGLGVPFLFGAMAYAAMLNAPKAKAKRRAKDIDQRIPYALNYIAAMASAGVNIDEVFRSLGEQGIYGECAREAGAVYRDMAYFGKDGITAMKRSIERSPSDKWSEFMQGAITTVTSGGNLQLYFSSKAQRYMWENRQDQKAYVDMMGLMAETYVTAAVAGPLFLIVMMAIMGMLGGEGPQQLYLVIYGLLPIANGGFVFALQNMSPEV
ncbi:MAG TPA: type II secretion system F family protein [Candidatus Thermoplasmatota archaeon]|nr:type II secretion system F family protein [Candidatus Thermoplasmatota archaeon]